jgi:uncharacterized protein (DUF433 family)
METLNQFAKSLKDRGVHVKISMDVDIVEQYEEKMSPDDLNWFELLRTSISDYLCGLGDEIVVRKEQERDTAVWWIFKSDGREWSFAEIWDWFFPDITADEVRAALKRRWQNKQQKAWRAKLNGKNKVESICGRQRNPVCIDHDSSKGVDRSGVSEGGFESILFG